MPRILRNACHEKNLISVATWTPGLLLLVALLTSTSLAQPSEEKELFLKCDLLSEAWPPDHDISVEIFYLNPDGWWNKVSLIRETSEKYIDSLPLEFSLLLAEKIESFSGRFGDLRFDAANAERARADNRFQRRMTEITLGERIQTESLGNFTSVEWRIDRLSGNAVFRGTSEALQYALQNEEKAMARCSSLARAEVVDLLDHYNEKLEVAKEEVRQSRRF